MFSLMSRSKGETQKVSRLLAKETRKVQGSVVFALTGNLGAGKTTFVQGFAKALGIKEKVLSPTFVIMKLYKIPAGGRKKHLIHMDCYRLGSEKDAAHLGLRNFFHDKDAIVLVEWAERIKKMLPKHTIWINFKHRKKINERILIFNETPRSH